MRRLLLAPVALLLAAAAWAIVPDPGYRRINVEQGLSQASAVSLAQDGRGLIWIGTQDGLNRFDGYRVRAYKREDQFTLADRYISALAAEGSSALWIGTRAGILARMDLASGELEQLSVGGDGEFRRLAYDGADTLWAMTEHGLVYRVDVGQRTLKRVEVPSGVRDFTLRFGTTPVLAGQNGIHELNRDGRLTQLGSDDSRAIAAGPSGSLVWLASDGGVLRLTTTGASETLSLRWPVADAALGALIVRRDGRVLIGTTAGLLEHDPATGLTRTHVNDPSFASGLGANRINSLLEAQSGALWIGTWTAGVSVLRPNADAIVNYRRLTADGRGVIARALALLPNGEWLVGTSEGQGLLRGQPTDDEFKVVPLLDATTPFARTLHIQALAVDGDAVYVGTREVGLLRAWLDGRPTEALVLDRDQAVPEVMALLRAPDGSVYVGTDGNGLYRISADGGIRHYGKADGLASAHIYALHYMQPQTLLIGYESVGLGWLDVASGEVEHTPVGRGQDGALQSGTITHMLTTRDGSLWIATQSGGVQRLLEGRGARARFALYDTANGLPSDAVGAIAEGLDGDFYIATVAGITRLRGGAHSDNLRAEDGVQTRGYFIGSAATTAEGQILFGGLDGLTRIDPKAIGSDPAAPQVHIVSIELDGRALALGHSRIDLPVEGNLLTLEFGSQAPALAARSRIEYRMVGFDDNWIRLGPGEADARYTRLPPGGYVFEVRAVGANGEPGPARSVEIWRPSPWYLTPFALAVYGLAALLFVGLVTYDRYRKRARELRAQMQLKASEEELALALWGSGDELWDLDLVHRTIRRRNPIPRLKVNEIGNDITIERALAYAHPDDAPVLLRGMRDHILGRATFFEANYRTMANDKEWVWVLARGRSVEKDARGYTVRVTGTIRDVDDLISTEDELKRLNQELEKRVADRTAAVEAMNEDLEEALNRLQATSEQLVQSEKMASLGSLVAGIAHEINTPVGVSVTAASHLEQEAREMQRAMTAGQVTKSGLENFLAETRDGADLILRNLNRAANLVRSFKQVAVDQSSEARREFKLAEYAEEVISSLAPRLKRSTQKVEIDIDSSLSLNSFPGALSQVLTNLIMNSLTHGFEDGRSGLIRIRGKRSGDGVQLVYSDDGTGMSPEVRARAFDPFFTTKRGTGGSGLGLHIVYNLITALLGGSVQLISSPGEGVEFLIWLPLSAPEKVERRR